MFFTVKSLREATLDLRCSLEFPETRKINDEDGGSRNKTHICVCASVHACGSSINNTTSCPGSETEQDC